MDKARISPLAMCLVKPPPAELIQTLSIKDQREFMAQWAEQTLSQTSLGSRGRSTPVSSLKSDSFSDKEGGNERQGDSPVEKRKGSFQLLINGFVNVTIFNVFVDDKLFSLS